MHAHTHARTHIMLLPATPTMLCTRPVVSCCRYTCMTPAPAMHAGADSFWIEGDDVSYQNSSRGCWASIVQFSCEIYNNIIAYTETTVPASVQKTRSGRDFETSPARGVTTRVSSASCLSRLALLPHLHLVHTRRAGRPVAVWRVMVHTK